jgi:phosphatidylglycerophosphatase A
VSKVAGALLTILATGFGTGYSPLAPGTAGSILSAAVFTAIAFLPGSPSWLRPAIGVLLVPAAFAGSARGERLWGHDPSRVTIDEVLGCWIACLLAPWSPAWTLAALALFRFFDILKPWPVCRLDRMGGPAGIVLDDVAAGILAGALALAGGVLLGYP